MSNSYYYFAASLVSLEFGMPAPQTSESFLEDCRRLLSASDARDVELLMSGAREGYANGILREWADFENNFANLAVRIRASYMRKEASSFYRGDFSEDHWIMEVLSQAQESHNPLEGEQVIAKAKWEKLDELTSGHFFDFEVIAAYAIKLRILERFDLFRSDKGKEVFDKYKTEALSVEQTVAS